MDTQISNNEKMNTEVINEECLKDVYEDPVVTILAVEDDYSDLLFIEDQITRMGHQMIPATDGQEALEILEREKSNIDIILMDREMPNMDGLTATRHIKDINDFKHIPIIMVTGISAHRYVKESLSAGVFYFLTKPVEDNMLQPVLSAAIREAHQARILTEELSKHRASFNLIETCKFKFRTLEEAESLAAFIANCFPNPARVLSGLGELMINAVEHGNLGFGYDQKTRLIETNTWRTEIIRMQNLSKNEGKYVTAILTRKPEGIYIVIEDQGEGFDWKKYLVIDPARAGDNHGRGIAQANMVSFDKLTYNEKGNKAIGFVSKTEKMTW